MTPRWDRRNGWYCTWRGKYGAESVWGCRTPWGAWWGARQLVMHRRPSRRKYLPPARYWRWLWLAYAFRTLVSVPVFAVLIGPYGAAQGYIKACDWLGSRFGKVYLRCLNADRERARRDGYDFAGPKASAVKLSDEWARKLGNGS